MHVMMERHRGRGPLPALLGIVLAVASCQPQREQAATAASPPVGHYNGSLSAAGQPEARAALDIRHPSPGHYEAELTVPAVGTLNFVGDTVLFSHNQLRLTRPARPGQTLSLALEGDFWRGTLAVDSFKAALILVKRGAPSPSTYRVEEVPQANGPGWLFAPSDSGTPGPALLLLPDAATAPAASLWADALAREGVIVLVLPVADSATAATEAPRLLAAVRLLHGTAGADTTNVGVWAAGARAGAVAQALVNAKGLRVAFAITQNAEIDAAGRAALRELQNGRQLPLLGLYGGAAAVQKAAALRNALGGRRGAVVRAYRTAGPDLLVPNGLTSGFGPGLPGQVVEWLRARGR